MTIYQMIKLLLKVPNGLVKPLWHNMKIAIMTPTGIQFLSSEKVRVIEISGCGCKNPDKHIILLLETKEYGVYAEEENKKENKKVTPEENANKEIMLQGDKRSDIAEIALSKMKQKSAKN